MNIDPFLLSILCCPEDKSSLSLAEPTLVATINQQIAAGRAVNRKGEPIREQLEGGLIRADGRFLYPIREQIPVMLIDEAIPLS